MEDFSYKLYVACVVACRTSIDFKITTKSLVAVAKNCQAANAQSANLYGMSAL